MGNKTMLNEKQKAAASDLNGTSIIIAGAGTGKTQTLVHKIVNLVNSGVSTRDICLLTFTNDAAKSMRERAVTLGLTDAKHLTACTYHSFCDRLIRTYGSILGWNTDYAIIEPYMVADIVDMKLQDRKGDLKEMHMKKPNQKAVAAVYSEAINRDMTLYDCILGNKTLTACHGGSPEMAKYLTEMLVEIYEEVAEYKTHRNLKDFDDLMVDACRLLSDNSVCEIVNIRYKYVLIDEYQDTNSLQAKLVGLLRRDCKNLTVVGDDYQSIYRFRGAEVKYFTDFGKQFEGAKEYYLTDNYRSTREILDLSNAVMDEHEKFGGYKKHLESGTKRTGKKPVVHAPLSQKEQTELVYKLIKQYLDAKYPDGKVAVLYRNSMSAAFIEAVLVKDKVNYEKHGGVAFFDKECVQTILAYMRVLANPMNELAWYRILMQYPLIGKKRAAELSALAARDLDFARTMPYRAKSTQTAIGITTAVDRLEGVLENLRPLEDAHDIMSILVEHYKELYEECEAENKEMQERKDAVFSDLDTLLEIASDGEYRDLQTWLDAATLREVQKSSNEECNVVLSTIHSAKGLEWEHVIILDCVEEIFPRVDQKLPASEIKAELDEELRCFYVAMTRAKDTLDMIAPRAIKIYNKENEGKLSRFLKGGNIADFYDFVIPAKAENEE